jgi:hypothetical protein
LIHSLVDTLTCGYTHIPRHTIHVHSAGESTRERDRDRERARAGGWRGRRGREIERDLSFHSAQCFVTSSTLFLLKQTNKQTSKPTHKQTSKSAHQHINTSSHFVCYLCVCARALARAFIRVCVCVLGGGVRACEPYPRTMAKTASYPPAPGTPPPNTPGIAAVESSNRV